MDTRTKIVRMDTAAVRARGTRSAVIAASFDVLTAARVRRVREIAEGSGLLIAMVLHPASPLLPGQARAELAASLAAVDLVVLLDEPADTWRQHFPASRIYDETGADESLTRSLIEHVQERNRVHGE